MIFPIYIILHNILYKSYLFSTPLIIQQSTLKAGNILFAELCDSIGFCEFDGGSE